MLSAGATLGPYEVISPLGAGGMGEVYRARDTKLGRDVALKVLPEGFTADADRLARFEREARLLAQLNHPNVATLHGLEASDEQAEVSGDGAWLLYRSSEEWLRAPIAGGPSEAVLPSGEEVHCAVPVRRCVLGERDETSKECVFSELDPLAGRGPELARIPDNPPFTNWDLSPDGKRVAVVNLAGKIRLLDLATGTERVLEDDAWFFGEFVSFAADGEAVYVDGSRAGRPAPARMRLLRVSLGGGPKVDELRHRRNVWHVRPETSPDGRHLAFGAMTFTANAWMISGVQ